MAHAAEPGGVCAAGELTLFACTLKTRNAVGFCLDKQSLKTRFSLRAADGRQAAANARNLRAATLGGNAQGDIVTLQADTPDGTVAIYVDFIPDDLEAPVLVTVLGKRERKELCATPDVQTEQAVLTVKGVQRQVRLGNLVESGLAEALHPVPEWPN